MKVKIVLILAFGLIGFAQAQVTAYINMDAGGQIQSAALESGISGYFQDAYHVWSGNYNNHQITVQVNGETKTGYHLIFMRHNVATSDRIKATVKQCFELRARNTGRSVSFYIIYDSNDIFVNSGGQIFVQVDRLEGMRCYLNNPSSDHLQGPVLPPNKQPMGDLPLIEVKK
jgi:hypothetical protein